jgi:hypothetical protein
MNSWSQSIGSSGLGWPSLGDSFMAPASRACMKASMRPAPTLLVLCVALVAHAEDDRERRAREELERQLSALVEKAPTRVKIEFQGLDEPNYELTEASVELDGKPLVLPALATLSGEGLHALPAVDVSPGSHVVKVRIACRSKASIVVSDEGGYGWTLAGQNAFDVNNGIEVQVKVVPTRVPQAKELAKRFRLSLPATPVMLAKLDDGKLPEPPPKPVVDAGLATAATDAGATSTAVPPAAVSTPAKAEKVVVVEKPQPRATEPTQGRTVAAREAREPAHVGVPAVNPGAKRAEQSAPVVAEVAPAAPFDALQPLKPVEAAERGAPPVPLPVAPVDPLPSPAAPPLIVDSPATTPWALYAGGGLGLLGLLVFLVTRRKR